MTKVIKKFSNSDGYTFIELFMTILIIALISSVIYTNSSTITDSMIKSKNHLASKYDLIRLKLILGEETQKITPPWFMKEHKIINNGNSVDIYYYNGNKDDYIRILSSENGISILINESEIFNSSNLKGEIKIDLNYIIYSDIDNEIIFPFGVFFA